MARVRASTAPFWFGTLHSVQRLPQRRLIVNADDFGRSHSINEAVIRAHREGILTTASLMVNGDACAEAVELARANPKLGVGLHLALICGRATAPIQGLADANAMFSSSPVAAGTRYFFQPSLRTRIEAELAAQFRKFHETGLILDHVNGHLHFHLHPTVFPFLVKNATLWKIERVRLTRDPLSLNLKLARGNYFYRLSHALIFGMLSARAARMSGSRFKFTDAVFGLLQNGRVDAAFINALIPHLPLGTSELYSHPSLDEFQNEFDGLIDNRVKAQIAANNIELIRYQDL